MTRFRSSSRSSEWVPEASRSLVSALVDPETLAALDHARWNSLLRQARRTRLLARLARDAERKGILDAVPPKARDLLTSARYVARDNARAIAWECNRIERALRPLNLPLVLLKGAAYATASLPPARGRLSTDVDILVPRAKLAEVERTLQAAGWEHVEPSNYVQRYYRRWMHELPPLRHATRGTFVDVHHTILPTTGRVQPDAERLWRDAVATDVDNIRVLAPEDMVLHSAAHLFQDGDLNYAIRDLVDVADLLRHFSRDPQFWGRLVERAALHELQRTLFYALRYGKAARSGGTGSHRAGIGCRCPAGAPAQGHGPARPASATAW